MVSPGGAGQRLYFQKQYSLARFGWICLDLARFGWIGGVAHPGLEVVLALVDEVLSEGGGQPGIAAKKRERRKNTRAFASFALFRGYFMVFYSVGQGAVRESLAWAGPRASARVPTMGA
jgi:hypothetical protein